MLDFLRHHEADLIYLVGDIVDGWRLRSGWYWPQTHNDVVQKLLRTVRKGARIIYLPGNHDELLRDYIGSNFGGIDILHQAIHTGADGRRFLVVHGDDFDVVVRHAQWLAHLGDWGYELALKVSAAVNLIRRKLGISYWSLSAWAKSKVKGAVNFIGEYEATLIAEAARHDVDGVVCGHIHHPVIRKMGEMLYVNTGDWVESCSAVIENYDGRLELVRWTTSERDRAFLPTVVEAAA